MKQQKLTLSLLITLSLVMVMNIGVIWENASVVSLKEESEILAQQAEAIQLIKKRWSVQESQNDFDYLKNHPLLIKQEKRGGNIYLEYDNLSSREFNAITNKLLNSMLNIKKLSLKRNGMSKGTIAVEIEL